MHTNEVYHKLVEARAWLPNKVLDTWYITRHVQWWRRVLDAGWQSQIRPFRAKVFLWRAIVGGLPLAMALKRRHILSPSTWVFMEDKAMPTPSYKVVFDYLRYWGMWFNWTMRNGFLFDGLHGVTQQLRRMKGSLFGNFHTYVVWGHCPKRRWTYVI